MQIQKNILIAVSIILLTSCTPTQTETLLPTEKVAETITPAFTSSPIPTETATNTPSLHQQQGQIIKI